MFLGRDWCYMLGRLFRRGVMEFTILIIGLLLIGSQIPGNSHIILR
jgi:hypothetical protein